MTAAQRAAIFRKRQASGKGMVRQGQGTSRNLRPSPTLQPTRQDPTKPTPPKMQDGSSNNLLPLALLFLFLNY